MRTCTRIISTAIVLLALKADSEASPLTSALDYGPHAVGFRATTEIDQSRSAQPRTSFDGKATTGETAMAIDIGIWYPAAASASGTRMTAEAYKSLRSAQARETAIADFTRMTSFAGLTVTADQARDALTAPTRAVRDAPPATGSFPIVVSGSFLGTGWLRAEYLASHGYIVVAAPSSARTATLQASRPEIALETQTRNLEFLWAFAKRLPSADPQRLGVMGVNFDGMAALMFEMRNMAADAIVSIDGYEAKAGSVATVRESPFYDPIRLRIPYLLFVQDEPNPSAALAHDRAIWNEFRYSRRWWYVLEQFNHGQLISDAANAPSLTAEQVAGHLFILKTIRQFLDGYVKRDASAVATLSRSPIDNGLPASLAKTIETGNALPPVPTSEEFETLIMSGAIERAAQVYRAARSANPGLELFDESTIGLYAFRYAQRKSVKEAYDIRTLAAEAFPRSPMAAYQLGIAAVDAGRPQDARAAFDRALTLLRDNSGHQLAPSQREELRQEIEKRLATLSGR